MHLHSRQNALPHNFRAIIRPLISSAYCPVTHCYVVSIFSVIRPDNIVLPFQKSFFHRPPPLFPRILAFVKNNQSRVSSVLFNLRENPCSISEYSNNCRTNCIVLCLEYFYSGIQNPPTPCATI